MNKTLFKDTFFDDEIRWEEVVGSGTIEASRGKLECSLANGENGEWVSGGIRNADLIYRFLSLFPSSRKISLTFKTEQPTTADGGLYGGFYYSDTDWIGFKIESSQIQVIEVSGGTFTSKASISSGSVVYPMDLKIEIVRPVAGSGVTSTTYSTYYKENGEWVFIFSNSFSSVVDSVFFSPFNTATHKAVSTSVDDVKVISNDMLSKPSAGGSRTLLVEIGGIYTGFLSNSSSNASLCADWVTLTRQAVTNIPSSPARTIDPFTGDFNSQGISLQLIGVEDILNWNEDHKGTTLTEDISKHDWTITVTDTSAFPSNGYIWIGKEVIQYKSKDATHFYWCARGALGTSPEFHSKYIDSDTQESQVVYKSNPFLVGRKVQLRWIDNSNEMTAETRFIGWLDEPSWDNGVFSFSCVNSNMMLKERKAMTQPFAKGKLLGGSLKDNKFQPFSDYISDLHDIIAIETDQPFSNEFGYMKIDNEVVKFNSRTLPSDKIGVVNSIGSLYSGYYFKTDILLKKGELIKVGSMDLLVVKITANTSTGEYTVWHNGSSNVSVGDSIYRPTNQQFTKLVTGQFNTKKETHKVDTEVTELRVLFGNRVSVALRLLTSTGSGSNGEWDDLPSGWGAGYDINLIDVDAFVELMSLADSSHFIYSEAVNVVDILKNLARLTQSSIYFNVDGILTVSINADIYPSSEENANISNISLISGRIPSWSAPMTSVFNSLTIQGKNVTVQDPQRDSIQFMDFHSKEFYGVREMEVLEDFNLNVSSNLISYKTLGDAILDRWSHPSIKLDVTLLYDENFTLELGDLVSVDLPLADGKGNSILAGKFFEVIELTPNDTEVEILVGLLETNVTQNTRLISFSGEVETVSGTTIKLKDSKITHFSNPDKNQPSEYDPLSMNMQNGTQDVHFLSNGDTVRIFDQSTYSGTVASHTTSISNVDYIARTFTVASLPSWTIASGDLVQYAIYSTTKSVHIELTENFAFLGDSSGTLGGDEPHNWGK